MFLDIISIGAHTGFSANNAYVLNILNINSNAMFIEPVPSLFNELVKNYSKTYPNNNFIFLNRACSNYIGTISLYVPNVPIYNKENEQEYINKKLVSWSDQLTSVLPNHIADHGLSIPLLQLEVACSTLDYIIKEYNITEINNLCIDTEGHDYEVLQGLNLDLIRPITIKFEHKHIEGSNKPLSHKYEDLISKLKKYGYSIKDMNTEDTIVSLI